MLNITTQVKSARNGAGNIIATARINGKTRQKTTRYDHSVSRERNHGIAAANLVLSNALDSIMGGLSKDAVLNATHEIVSDGKHRFSLPV